MEETLEQARALDQQGRTVQVLVLVKTTPVPSKRYEDTVCVAGVALSPGPLRWVRLYPIPFRHLDLDQQFPKYGVIKAPVSRPRHGDTRPESLRIQDVSQISLRERLKPGSPRRHQVMVHLKETTACELRRGAQADPGHATSLGLVRPISPRLRILQGKKWSDRQKRLIIAHAAQGTLDLGPLTRQRSTPPLEPPPFQAVYGYQCETEGCTGHNQTILDWELTALQRRAQAGGQDPREWIRQKYSDLMLAPGRHTRLILGNQYEGHKRHDFSVLSVYYPREMDFQKALGLESRLF